MRDRAGALLLPVQKGACQRLRRVASVAQHANAQCGGALRQSRRAGVVGANHQRATGFQALDEAVEHRAVCLGAAEEIQVVGLDVGHHRDVGCVLQQRPVALVGLGDEALPAAVVSVGACLAEVAAHRERRVKPAVLQRHDEHRRGGRLAVGAGDHQRGVSGHQLGQHHRPQDHRDAAATRLDQFGVGLGNGGVSGDHRGRPAGQQVQ